ncbi:MAG TPA: tetratricopeptide repeat protein [Planctomycetota bacterium]|jgi:cytochrome c-type biogenesis protein CcmH/NrfG|nr:tetratricopeptide repeat protein [Planctomycetota bacterium]
MNAFGSILALALLATPCVARRAPDGVNELIARGREALEAGRPADAQKLFDEAAAKDNGTLRTKTWVLRSWMDQGRINDALDAIDAISKTGAKGPEVDYLYGMAFARKARGYMDSNVAGGPVQMALDDAVQFLERAVKADPELARDAFLPLAEAAWYGQKLDVARSAAETAVKRTPKSADAQFMLGRIALSQFSAAKDDANRKAEADENWEAARAAFTRAVDLLGAAPDPAARDMLVRVHVDLGHTYVWKEKFDEAKREYAAAMVRNPALVDMGQVQRALGTERMLAALETAVPAFAARPGADVSDVAALTWWLGWARYDQKQWAKADEAFSVAVAKAPRFVNSWHYIALARFQQKDFEGSYAAIRKHWDENPSDLVAAVGGNPDASIPLLDGLVAWCAENKRNTDAAFLSELETNAAPSDSRYWNNAGLFWRDAGEILSKSERAEDKTLAQEDFEKSWKAYTKALDLDPENPALLNDAAVILHYYLDRDLERAKDMYRKAAARAKEELAKPDLKPDLRELYETALRDSTNNLAKLEKGEKRE